jgi:gliding motility-associated-like protein
MKKTILLFIGLFLVFPVFSQYDVKGLLAANNTYNRIQVYLFNGLSGAEISFTSASEKHQWYKYDTRAGEAIAIPCQQTGNTSKITDLSDGFGYFVGLNQPDPLPYDPNSTSYVWIIDYSKYIPRMFSLAVSDDGDKCEYVKLLADVEAEPLVYRTYSGAPVSLERKYRLLYSAQEWNESKWDFDKDVPKEETINQTDLIPHIVIKAPLQNTTFTLTEDEYSGYFGLKQEVSTPLYEAVAVEAHVKMTPLREKNLNEQSAGANETDFSAPVEIDFTAYTNEVATRYRWEIKKTDPVKKDSILIFSWDGKVLPEPYKFEEAGNYTVQLTVGDKNSICFNNSQIFNIFIGDSELQLPNAFSPGSSPGINDEYRVSYKSLVSFKASIYNRWGNLLFHWEDPAQGWDGKAGGKFVPAGVYFIVVEAKGADGKTYTRSSDINILRTKNN